MPCSVSRKSCTLVPAKAHHLRSRAVCSSGYSREPTTMAASVQPITCSQARLRQREKTFCRGCVCVRQAFSKLP